MKTILLLLFITLVSCNRKSEIKSKILEIDTIKVIIIEPEKQTIPESPFVVIDCTIIKDYIVGSYDIKYKILDLNKNIFYYSEHVGFSKYPRYKIGDTIK